MATSLVIEEESGTYTGHVHPHNGYYAGSFSRMPATLEVSATVLLFRPATVRAPLRNSAAA
jgi:hypothetical protein